MLKFLVRGYQFARQPNQQKQNKQIEEKKETEEKMKKMQQLVKYHIIKDKYLDPQTSDALDKYIDSFNSSSFSTLITKISQDITSEHSHFKQICKQASQNKDLKLLINDKNSEFMKQMQELQKSLAPNSFTNSDDTDKIQSSLNSSQQQQKLQKNEKKKRK